MRHTPRHVPLLPLQEVMPVRQRQLQAQPEFGHSTANALQVLGLVTLHSAGGSGLPVRLG